MKEYLLSVMEQGNTLTMEEIMLHLLVSVLIGFVIFISYWVTHAGTIYSKKFNVSLVMLTVLTTTVITVIGNNIALSLGMVGALSIVRFRTAIKDARDTVYIFWTIVAGICCGGGDYMIASLSSGALFVILLVLGRIKNDTRKLLIIRGKREQQATVESVVFNYFKAEANLRVLNSTSANIEFIYEVSDKMLKVGGKSGKSLTEVLYEVDGIEMVNIVSQNDNITG